MLVDNIVGAVNWCLVCWMVCWMDIGTEEKGSLDLVVLPHVLFEWPLKLRVTHCEKHDWYLIFNIWNVLFLFQHFGWNLHFFRIFSYSRANRTIILPTHQAREVVSTSVKFPHTEYRFLRQVSYLCHFIFT